MIERGGIDRKRYFLSPAVCGPCRGLLALVLACAAAVGCGGPKEEKAPSSEAGKAALAPGVKGGATSEAAGVPIYPDARYMEDLSMERTRIGEAAARLSGMDTRVWVYYSDDGAEKVIRWYADKLGVQPAVVRFDLGRVDKRRMGRRGTEAHFRLAPLREGREGSRSLSVMDHDIQMPPGGARPGERVRLRVVDKTTIRIVEISTAPDHRAPAEEPPR